MRRYLRDRSKRLEVLQKMWGKDVKHMRSISNFMPVFISQGPQSRLRDWYAEVRTTMKLLPYGTIVIQRLCQGSYGPSRPVKERELCLCSLETVAASSAVNGRDGGCLLELLEQIAPETGKTVKAKVCDLCKRPCITLLDRRQVDGRGSG